MKIYTYIYHLIIGIFITSTLTSCLKNNTPDNFFPTLGTVILKDHQTMLESDSYGLLSIQNPKILQSADADSSGQRVLAGIQFLETADMKYPQVQILGIYAKVLTKKANYTDSENMDAFGNSPIQITATSISTKHLNIQFELNHTKEDDTHRISLVVCTNVKPDSEGLLPVELRLHSLQENNKERVRGIISFTLESIPAYQLNQVKGFRIIYNSGANSRAEWIIRKQI